MTQRSIANGRLKARVTTTRDGYVRVTLMERSESQTALSPTGRRAARVADYKWRSLWTRTYAGPFHVVCDRAHEHVMADRRYIFGEDDAD
jgi:hypothetical protein